MTILGIDVSHYQGSVDWAKAHANGVGFAFAKASEGGGLRDGQFSTNIAGMRKAGVVPGAYHFLTTANASAQADWFCSIAPADVIHALDVEGTGLDAAGWVKRYRTHYPHKRLLIYTGRDLWTRAAGGNGAALGPLWAAGYLPNAYLPGGSLTAVAARIGSNRGGVPFAGWTQPLFLQFTDKAVVPGVSGPCDGDIFYATTSDLQSLTATEPDMPLSPADLAAIKGLLATEGTATTTAIVQQVVQQLRADIDPQLTALQAQSTAQATALAAVTATVQAIAAASPTDIKAAFDAGVQELEAQLAQIRVVVEPQA